MNPQLPHIKVIIAEDQSIILHAMVLLLKTIHNVEVIGTAGNGEELLRLLDDLKPDIILTDIRMPLLDGFEATRVINEKMPWLKVIVLSVYDHPAYIKKLMKNGARGFVSKNSTEQELEKALITVYNGGTYISDEVARKLLREFTDTPSQTDSFNYNSLTSREIQIIQLLSEGMSTREIAEKLFISNKTVERHKTNILKKTNTRNTPHLIRLSIQNGIIFN